MTPPPPPPPPLPNVPPTASRHHAGKHVPRPKAAPPKPPVQASAGSSRESQGSLSINNNNGNSGSGKAANINTSVEKSIPRKASLDSEHSTNASHTKSKSKHPKFGISTRNMSPISETCVSKSSSKTPVANKAATPPKQSHLIRSTIDKLQADAKKFEMPDSPSSQDGDCLLAKPKIKRRSQSLVEDTAEMQKRLSMVSELKRNFEYDNSSLSDNEGVGNKRLSNAALRKSSDSLSTCKGSPDAKLHTEKVSILNGSSALPKHKDNYNVGKDTSKSEPVKSWLFRGKSDLTASSLRKSNISVTPRSKSPKTTDELHLNSTAASSKVSAPSRAGVTVKKTVITKPVACVSPVTVRSQEISIAPAIEQVASRQTAFKSQQQPNSSCVFKPSAYQSPPKSSSWLHTKQKSVDSLLEKTLVSEMTSSNKSTRFRLHQRQNSSDCLLKNSAFTPTHTKVSQDEKSTDQPMNVPPPPPPPNIPPRQVSKHKISSTSAHEEKRAVIKPDRPPPPLPPKTGKREVSLLETIEGSLGISLDVKENSEDPPPALPEKQKSKEAEDMRRPVDDCSVEKSVGSVSSWKSLFALWGDSPRKNESPIPVASTPGKHSLTRIDSPFDNPDHMYCYIDYASLRKTSDYSSPTTAQDDSVSSLERHDSGINLSSTNSVCSSDKSSTFSIRNLFCMAPATTYGTLGGPEGEPPPLPPARKLKHSTNDSEAINKSRSLPATAKDGEGLFEQSSVSLPMSVRFNPWQIDDIIYMDTDEAVFAERPSDSSSDDSSDEEESDRDVKQKTKLFHIAQEMSTTELAFVNSLKLLNKDFRDTIHNAGRDKGKPVIPEEVLNSMLLYLPQLHELNSGLAADLSSRIDNWKENPRISDIFVRFGPFLKLYASYIKDFPQMTQALNDAMKKYSEFGKAVRDFEASPCCARLAVQHYMLKPVQRIPQYRMLLQDYLKHLPDKSADRADTETALKIVSDVANHANETIKKEEKFEKLFQLQERLIGGRVIVKPGRLLLKQGEVFNVGRKDHQTRNLFLLNDVLLYTVPLPNTMYKLSAILPLSGMKVLKPSLEAYKNEFHIVTVERSFLFSTRTAYERDEWICAIGTAIDENAVKKSTFKAFRASIVEKNKTEKQGKIGAKAPVWIPETRATICMLCTNEFGVRSRKHHCRACGKLVCSNCCANKAPLLYRKYQSARVCDVCYDNLYKELVHMADEDVRSSVYEMKDDIYGTVQECYGLTHNDIKSRFKKGNILRKVKQVPQRLKVSANDAESDISGYLHKHLKKHKWTKMWFVLKNKVLYEYKASEDVVALKATPLLGYEVKSLDTKEAFDGIDAKLVFQLLHKGKLMFVFHADDIYTQDRWINAICEATVLE